MTQQPEQEQPLDLPPVDPGNRFVLAGDWPTDITPGFVNTPRGMRMTLTIRIAATTVTVQFTRDMGAAFAARLSMLVAEMPRESGIIVPPSANGIHKPF